MFKSKITNCTTEMLRNIFNSDTEKTRYHEAGHVLANHLLNTNSSVTKVSCKQTFFNAGKTTININLKTPEHIKAHIVHLMAGSAAEKILMGADYKPYGTKADKDEAKFFIEDVFGRLSKPEMEEMIRRAEKEAYELLSKNRDKLELLVSALASQHELDAPQIHNLLDDKQSMEVSLYKALE